MLSLSLKCDFNVGSSVESNPFEMRIFQPAEGLNTIYTICINGVQFDYLWKGFLPF